MSTFKVTLWSNSDYCRLRNDYEECAFVRKIEADSRYEAACKAIRPYIKNKAKGIAHDDHPRIYEIEECES